MPDYETTRLINSVLSLYYLDGLTQAQIGRRLGLSTSKVNRLLQKARELGYVTINIRTPLQHLFDLESQIKSIFNLQEVIVIPSVGINSNSLLSGLGTVAADYLLQHIKDGDVIGIGGGTAVNAVVQSIAPHRQYDLAVVPLLGAVQGQMTTDVNYLADRLAKSLGGTAYQLHAPAFVDTQEHCQTLLSISPVKEIIEIASKATIALFGIGTVDPDISRFVQFTALSPADMERIANQCGAVGEISAIVYEINGKACASEYNNRVVGLDLEKIHQIPFRIGVAASAVKASAIYGALRGQHIHVLITDEAAAKGILELVEQHQKELFKF